MERWNSRELMKLFLEPFEFHLRDGIDEGEEQFLVVIGLARTKSWHAD